MQIHREEAELPKARHQHTFPFPPHDSDGSRGAGGRKDARKGECGSADNVTFPTPTRMPGRDVRLPTRTVHDTLMYSKRKVHHAAPFGGGTMRQGSIGDEVVPKLQKRRMKSERGSGISWRDDVNQS
jgi:hypothetical protein